LIGRFSRRSESLFIQSVFGGVEPVLECAYDNGSMRLLLGVHFFQCLCHIAEKGGDVLNFWSLIRDLHEKGEVTLRFESQMVAVGA